MSIYEGHGVTLHHGDCLDVLRSLPDCSVDSVVCDPPYALGFMGREWDTFGMDVGRGAQARKQRAAEVTPDGQGHSTSAGPYLASGVDSLRAAGMPFQRWCEAWAAECLRVLRPGGHLLAFGGTRTWHRLACAVEDAGFEVRDSIAWLYGSGFPKSLDVSKAIDKRRHEDRGPMLAVRAWLNAQRLAAGVTLGQINAAFGLATNGGGNASNWTTHPSNIEVPSWEKWEVLRGLIGFGTDMDAEVWRLNGRKGKPGEAWENADVIGVREGAMAGWSMDGTTKFVDREEKAPATDAAREWAGWGTALKPAFEPVVVARKPLAGTVAANVLEHGTGALNVDGCRIDAGQDYRDKCASVVGLGSNRNGDAYGEWTGVRQDSASPAGRWPANVVLDETQAEALDEQSGTLTSGANPTRRGADGDRQAYGEFGGQDDANPQRGSDSGGASRFFYVAKADASERPRLPKRSLRLRDDLTPEQVDHVRARLVEAGVQVD